MNKAEPKTSRYCILYAGAWLTRSGRRSRLNPARQPGFRHPATKDNCALGLYVEIPGAQHTLTTSLLSANNRSTGQLPRPERRLSRRKRGKAFAAVESVDEVEHGPLSAVCVDPP
ncbi:hypothetical protein, partial [Micromonospora sp. NPDC051296]|uniref:hypothetical protein n=1 Tax=Micromonospora sp. NPDC051296 TaxID=3155046 RepID=UPI00342A8D10